MKKLLVALCVLTGFFLVSNCALTQMHNGQNTGSLLPGIYEGSSEGYRGEIHVRLHIEGGSITEIEIIDSVEDRFVGETAMEELLELVLIYNTTDLDIISGATESSEGFLAAVADALEKSR